MSRAVLAFSGGLDTRYCAVWLREELGHDVVTVTVDTGGLREDDHLRLAERSAACGAVEHVLVDGRRRVWDECVSWLIRGNVLRGGVYPVCVGAERLVQADETANVARAQDASIVAHGSTGAGNDGVRFDVALAVRLPEAEILAPVRDHGVTREASAAYLREHGLSVRGRGPRATA
jgi:argininosuccinate synthase